MHMCGKTNACVAHGVALTMAAFGAFAAGYDNLYTAETGYVTLKKSDSSSVTSAATAGNWSDEREPHSDTNYYIGVGLALRSVNDTAYNNTTFAGSNLVVAGQITHSASSGKHVRWGDTIFLPGSKYYFNSIGSLMSGEFYMQGTEESPVTFSLKRSDNPGTVRTITQYQNFHSGPDVFVTAINSGTPVWFKYQGDWSDFYGTYTCMTNFGVTIPSLAGGFSCPGRFVVPKDSELHTEGTANVVTFGSLSVEEGGKVSFAKNATSSLFHVTNRLTLAAGATVDSSNTFDCAVLEPHTSTVFRLSPRAARPHTNGCNARYSRAFRDN